MRVQQTLTREIMSRPALVIQEDATLDEALALMEERRVRRLPVVDENGRLVGILSRGDVREATAVRATVNPYAPEAQADWLTVSEVMTPDPMTVSPDTPVWQVAETMLEHKIGGLPVVDSDGNLIGLVTDSDIFRLVVETWRSIRDERTS